MEELLLAAELKQQLDALRPIDREQENKIMQKFRLDWNYHSNNLEGNSLTYGETKALLFFGVTAQGKPLKDHFEVTGHNEAINWVIDVVKGDYPLTQNFIRELHKLLLKERYQVDAKTPDGQPTKKWVEVGVYKSSPNHVETKTGEIFYFATVEETLSKMGDLMDWYNERIEAADLNPILLAAEFHYKFIRIHPFDDGNGRTARILMNFILMKFGYPPVIIKTEDKENYFAALRLADVGELEAFVNYIAKNLVRSLEIMLAGARGESIEEPDDIDKEIALLEKRLNSIEGIATTGKTNIEIHKICEEIIFPIQNNIYEKSEKLKKYYLEYYNYYTTNNNTDNHFTEYGLSSKDFEDDKYIYMVYEFQTFRALGFGEFNFLSFIAIKLNTTFYSILNSKKEILFKKPYGFYLSNEEINSIVINEIKLHTSFIEQKISEKESGQA